MSTSGMVILFTSLFLLAVIGMVAFIDFHAQVNSSDPVIQSASNTAQSAETPIITVIGILGLAVAAIALLRSFGSL
jgi:hypothetical protein